MPKTLFVHVGPRKTGTSAIQNCLASHDNSVVIYPKVGLHGPGSHHKVVYKFFGDRVSKALRGPSVDRYFERISDVALDSDLDVVISSEALEEDDRDAGAFIRALLPHVSRTPVDVEIIVGCREHFARTASWYNHRMRALKGTNQRSLPDEFLDDQAAGICYAPLIRRMRDTGFPVTALNYSPSSTWTDRFFGHLGFPADKIPKSDMKNVSISTKVLIAKIAANQVMDSKEERRNFLDAFMQLPDVRRPSGFIFGREAAERADVVFAEDRKFLADEYGLQIVPPDITEENSFFLYPSEFDDIVKIANDFGDEGTEIVRYARQYVRDVPQPEAGTGSSAG